MSELQRIEGPHGQLAEAKRDLDNARKALAEVVRLRLAITEGTCAQRFDRAWQVATDALTTAK